MKLKNNSVNKNAKGVVVMKRLFALVLTVVMSFVMFSGCASDENAVPSVTLTIAEDTSGCLAFEYNGDEPYCFYGYDIDGKYYRVIWDDFGGLYSGDVIRVEHSEEIKSLTYDEYVNGWTPQYEVKATAIRMQQRANENLVFHISIKSGKNEIYPYGRLLQIKEKGEVVLSTNVVAESTVITKYRDQIPEIVFDGPVTYSIQFNGRVKNIRLYDYNGENLKGVELSFDDLSDLEEGTYYVVFYVSLEGNCDPDAPQYYHLYEDMFALIVE